MTVSEITDYARGAQPKPVTAKACACGQAVRAQIAYVRQHMWGPLITHAPVSVICQWPRLVLPREAQSGAAGFPTLRMQSSWLTSAQQFRLPPAHDA